MIYPEPLKAGDKICILSPAGRIDSRLLEKSMGTLVEWHLQPWLAPHAASEYGRFAGTEAHRLADLQQALTDSDIKAILCSRGGYGAVQLIENLDRLLVSNNPKWLIGYSDITLLHAFFNNAGVVSLHAPMCKHLAEHPDDDISAMMRDILFGGIPSYTTDSHLFNRKGSGEGHLAGGNLAVLSGLHGSPFDFNYENAILFIEDIGESPYKIERMLYSLRLSGIFKQIKGLIVGQFSDCPEDPLMGNTIYENIRDLVAAYDFPVCFNFPCGHVDYNVPLLEGATVRLEVGEANACLRFIK